MQRPHDRVRLLRVELSAQQQSAKHRDQRHRNDHRAGHRKRFCESQRMKQLSFFSGERENRNEREDDDGHRKEDWPPHQTSRFQHGLPDE